MEPKKNQPGFGHDNHRLDRGFSPCLRKGKSIRLERLAYKWKAHWSEGAVIHLSILCHTLKTLSVCLSICNSEGVQREPNGPGRVHWVPFVLLRVRWTLRIWQCNNTSDLYNAYPKPCTHGRRAVQALLFRIGQSIHPIVWLCNGGHFRIKRLFCCHCQVCWNSCKKRRLQVL